jgi:Skp family chaperone for outer membrane proteins
MRSLKIILGLALAGAMAAAASSSAQTAAAPPAAAGPALVPPTVALVDVQRVVADSAAGKSMLAQLEGERKKIRDQLARLEEELKNKDNELRRQRSILSQDAFNEQAQTLARTQAEDQRIAQERQEAFNKGANDAQAVIYDNMRDVIQQISGERRIGLVLRKDLVLALADKNTDITDDVIQRLNTKLPSVTVTVPAPGSQPAAAAAPAAAKAPAKK